MTPRRPVRPVGRRRGLRCSQRPRWALGLAIAVDSRVRDSQQPAATPAAGRRAAGPRPGRGGQPALGDPTELVDVPAEALGAADVRIGLVGADGRRYFASGSERAPVRPERASRSPGASWTVRSAPTDGRGERVPGGRRSGPTGLALVLAQSTADAERTLDRLGWCSSWSAALGRGARRLGRPGDRARRAASGRSASPPRPSGSPARDRLEPIEVRGHDELARLATSFNAMLARAGRVPGTTAAAGRRCRARAAHAADQPAHQPRPAGAGRGAARAGGSGPPSAASCSPTSEPRSSELSGLVERRDRTGPGRPAG